MQFSDFRYRRLIRRKTNYYLHKIRVTRISPMENGASSESKDPSGFLSEIIGAPVTVKLNSGVVYKGSGCRLDLRSCVLTAYAQGSFNQWTGT